MDDEKLGPDQHDVGADNPPPEARKVVPLRPSQPSPQLDPRLEEIRQLLSESEPIDTQYSDDEVIKDEHKFRRRFGLGFHWNHRDRRGLIELKRQYDLTDREIRLFHYTGNLRKTIFGVVLTANRWVALWGGVQLAFFGLLFVTLFLSLWPRFWTEPSQTVKPLMALIVLLLSCVVIYWLYVKPWLVQRQLFKKIKIGPAR